MAFPSSADVFADMEADLESSSESPLSDPMELDIAASFNPDDSPIPSCVQSTEKPVKQKKYQTVNTGESLQKMTGRYHMDFVGMVTYEGKISLGATVNGLKSQTYKKAPMMPKNSKSFANMMRSDFGVLETVSADATVGTLKETFPKKKHIILLDRKWNVNSEVFHRSNPRRFGHVTSVVTSADCYLSALEKVVLDVPVNKDTYVTSFNSSYWRQQPLIFLEKKRGRVMDALYECILRDDSGHRMKLELKAHGSFGRMRRKADHRMIPSVITSGDQITFSNTVGLEPQWLGDAGTVDKETEWLVEKVVLQKVSVRWEPSAKPTKSSRYCPSASFGMPIDISASSAVLDLIKNKALTDLTESVQKKDTPGPTAPNDKQNMNNAVEAFEGQFNAVHGFLGDAFGHALQSFEKLPDPKTSEGSSEMFGQLNKMQEQLQESLTMTLEQGSSFVVSGPGFFSHSSADSMFDSPLIKRKRPDGPVNTSEWIDVAELLPHSLLPPKRDVVLNTKLKLTGTYKLLSSKAYYNSLLPKFEKHLDKKLEPIPANQSSEEALLDTYGEVINRHHKVTVHWFDGEIEEDVTSSELEQVYRKNFHPTSVNVYRNMMLRKNRTSNARKEDRASGDKEGFNEFGLVTKISEEKMLTVVWFKKEFEDGPKYIKTGEEVISQYEHLRHSLSRIPLHTHVYFPGDRDPDNIYHCIGKVISLNDDGTQTLQYFDGDKDIFWPNEAIALDSDGLSFDGFAEFGGFLGYDDDYPTVDTWDSDEEEPMDDPMTEISSYSSLGSFSLGSTPSDLQSYLSNFTPSSSIIFGPSTPGTAFGVKVLGSKSVPSSETSSTSGSLGKIGPPPPLTSSIAKGYYGRAAALRNGTALEPRFVESMKKNKRGWETPDGMALLAAIFVNLEPSERKSAWDETHLALNLDSVDAALNCDQIQDAERMIRLLFNNQRTKGEEMELTSLAEKRPDLRQKIEELFEYKKGIHSEIVSLVHSLYNDLDKQNLYRRDYRKPDEMDSKILVIYPVEATSEVKSLLDEKISPSLTKADRYYRPRILMSYLCPPEYCPFLEMSEGQAAYICHFSGLHMPETSKEAATAYAEKCKTDKDAIIVGSMKSVKMYNCLKIAHKKILENDYSSDERTEILHMSEDFEWVCATIFKADSGDSNHPMPYYVKKPQDGVHEPQKEKLNKLDLQLDQVAESLKFDHDRPLPINCKSTEDPDNLYLHGEIYPDIPQPRALVLQVSPSLKTQKLTDSFLVFQILSQIVDCSTWPECSVKISKDSGNNGTLTSNFCAAWMILHRSGDIFNSRYFNIAEAKNMAFILNNECTHKGGPFHEKYGAETVKLIRNILMKMSSLSCVKFWRRINLFEKTFGISRVLEAVKEIMAGGGTKSVIPFRDLPEMTQSCTDVDLKNELATIQLNYVPSLQEPTTTQGTFKMVDSVSSHSFSTMEEREMRRDFVATIKKEHKLLRDNIPEGVHVVAFANRLDLFRAIIVGPVETPYEDVPFLFDIYLDPMYPQVAPKVKYVSLTRQAINPNLYTEGTVCLSLLGTWKGETQTMRWIPGTSSLLQVVSSIQVEILMSADPYFNEPGFEIRRETEDGKNASKHYNSQVAVGANEYFAEFMKEPPIEFIDFLQDHRKIVPSFIKRWTDILYGKEQAPFNVDINESVRHVIRRCHERLQTAVDHFAHDENRSTNGRSDDHLTNLAQIFSVDPSMKLTLWSSGNPAATDDCDLASFVLLRQNSH